MSAGTLTPHTLSVLVTLAILGCSSAQQQPDQISEKEFSSERLFDATTILNDDWMHVVFSGKTEYRLAILHNRIAIRAMGRHSASGLIRYVAIDPIRCPIVEWSWSVTRIQLSADLNVKALEDIAASVFLLFGDPGMLFDPEPVPTLRYVWTNERLPLGSVIDNPYLPGVVKSIVVRRGTSMDKLWVTERRNIVEDFTLAFGYAPTEPIQAVVLFTDNDQTNEPVEAYYGTGYAVCSPELAVQ